MSRKTLRGTEKHKYERKYCNFVALLANLILICFFFSFSFFFWSWATVLNDFPF